MSASSSTLDFSLETIRERHEHPTDPSRRLVMHVGEHSVQVAGVAQEIAGAIDPEDKVLDGIVWSAGLMHDLEHFDSIKPTDSGVALLERTRLPISDGRAELISSVEAYDYLFRRGYKTEMCEEVADAIHFGTSYQFVDGGLSHVYIDKAKNPLSAFVVAKADLVGLLTLHSDDMLDATLRFFLERYPDLAEQIITSTVLPTETFEELREQTLPDYGSEECDFMTDQYEKLQREADKYLTRDQKKRVVRLFDIGTFIATHQWCLWSWLETTEEMTSRLHRALPATYKNPTR